MRVGLVTTWGVPCGHAELSSNIVENLPHIEFIPITDMTDKGMLAYRDSVDIFHISWSGVCFSGMTPDVIKVLHDCGKKIVMTNYTTKPGAAINNHPIFDVVDKVFTTEKIDDPRFEFMPHGIPDNWIPNTLPEKFIGTIGFPFTWKGLENLAYVAQQSGFTFLGILPDYPSALDQCRLVRDKIRSIQPEAIIHQNWLPREEVKKELGRCAVQLFAHHPPPGHWTLGVSSACRYGIATGRPCVFNRFEMYRDLFEYEDELYFVQDDNIDNLVQAVIQASEGAKHPSRILADCSWKRCANRIEQVYNELLGKVN